MAGRPPEKPAKAAKKPAAKPASGEPVLLSGGHPQIPKVYGDAPVQAYIAAMWITSLHGSMNSRVCRFATVNPEKATAIMKRKIAAKEGEEGNSPSQLVDAKIKGIPDWRGAMLARIRQLIKEADPEVVEEVKWRKPSNPSGVPVWSHDGIICTGETYKDKVKLTFAKGASLDDPKGLFNASLDGNARRAIDLHEGDRIDEDAFKTLIRAAVALNARAARPRSQKRARPLEDEVTR